MKKFLFICLMCLGLTACSGRQPMPPETLRSFVPTNTSMQVLENTIPLAVSKTHWRTIDRNNNQFIIEFNKKGMHFTAVIQYAPNNYSISFNQVIRTDEDLDYTYRYYNKLALKLDRVIQKYLAETNLGLQPQYNY